jgi:hypothetical protein
MQVGLVALKLYGIEFANLGDNVRTNRDSGEEKIEIQRKRERKER